MGNFLWVNHSNLVDSLKGFRSLWRLNLGWISLKNFSAPSGETIRRVQRILEVQVWYEPPAGGSGGGGEKNRCFLFVRHVFERRDCANDFAMKAFEYEHSFDALIREGWYCCAPTLNLFSTLLGGATTECLRRKCGRI